MDLHLNGKTAVITGGSKGIGKGAAFQLAEEGCNLHLVSRTKKDLDQTAEQISKKFSVKIQTHALNLATPDASSTLLSQTGTPDILINNAGAIPAGSLEDITDDRWRDAWDLKVFGYINTCRTYYNAMKIKGGGAIINVTGLAGERLDAGYIAGTTGNAGLNAFSRALGSKSLQDGIRVMVVSPGAVETDRLVTLMKTRSQNEFGTPDRWQGYLSNLPLQRARLCRGMRKCDCVSGIEQSQLHERYYRYNPWETWGK